MMSHFDLGLKKLLPEWRALLTTRDLFNDLTASLAVTCIAIPLSLAIALASGVPPEVGLISAIIAGIVCALWGGVPLAVSGPAAAMAVLIASVANDFGLTGLLMVGLGCGLLQLISGVFGFGKLIRFIPVPVIMGLTSGMGALILISQFPRILGLPAPINNDFIGVIFHVNTLISETNISAFFLAAGTFFILFFLSPIWPRLPGPLLAIAIPSALAYYLRLHVDMLGNISTNLFTPKLPFFTGNFTAWFDLITTTFVVYAIASLETLLSSNAVDQLAKNKPHDPNQELIGQGLGNIVVSLFGGIPITAVIARSAVNVEAGAKTRRSSIFHSILLLATIYFFTPLMSHIPIAVLAGLIVTIALRMCAPYEFLQLWHRARREATIYLITFFMIVILGLLFGIQVGIIAALLFSALRLSHINIRLHINQYGPAQLSLEGACTFLCARKINKYETKLAATHLPSGLIIDLSRLQALDSAGAKHLIHMVEHLEAKRIKSVLYVTDPDHTATLVRTKPTIISCITTNELGMETILGIQEQHQQLIFDRVLYGIEKFKQNLQPKHKSLFSSLAKAQKPHTLFITCSDSRIDPNLITSTQPGELFIVRNVGNIVPPFGLNGTPAEGAAIEYALGVLNVNQIIICAHSECGAIEQIVSGAIFSAENQKKYPCVASWLSLLNQLRPHFKQNISSEQAAKLNASLQLTHLKTYPIIQEKISTGALKLKALFYDIGKADIQMWDEVLGKYVVIGESTEPLVFGANRIKGLTGLFNH